MSPGHLNVTHRRDVVPSVRPINLPPLMTGILEAAPRHRENVPSTQTGTEALWVGAGGEGGDRTVNERKTDGRTDLTDGTKKQQRAVTSQTEDVEPRD